MKRAASRARPRSKSRRHQPPATVRARRPAGQEERRARLPRRVRRRQGGLRSARRHRTRARWRAPTMCQSAARGERCGLCFYIAYRLNSPGRWIGTASCSIGPTRPPAERRRARTGSGVQRDIPLRAGLPLVHRRFRHAGPERCQGAVGGTGAARGRAKVCKSASGSNSRVRSLFPERSLLCNPSVPPTGASSWTPGLPRRPL